MAVKTPTELKAFANLNRTSNGVNSNTGATENTLWIDVIDSFFSKLGDPAVTGSGATNKITRWASANIAEAGNWTQAVNSLIPDNNNSSLGSDTLGVQGFFAAATTTTAPINLKSSAGTIPTGTNRKAGMIFFDGTSFFAHKTDNAAASDIFAAHPVISNNIIPVGNGTSVVDGTWELNGNDIIPTTTNSNIGKITTNLIKTIYGLDFTLGEVAADTGNFYLSHPSKHNVDDFALRQLSDGETTLNGITGKSLFIAVDDISKIVVKDGSASGIDLARTAGDVVAIGVATAVGAARLNIVGLSDDNTKNTLTVSSLTGSAGDSFVISGDDRIGMGTTTLNALVNLGAATTSVASLNIPDGTAPSSPNDGDFWSESGVPKIRTNGVTKDIGGIGDVTKVGTPVDNQVGVWTGDGTIEGDADLTFDGIVLTSKQQTTTLPSTLVPSGTTQTVNWNDGMYQIIDLGSASGDVTLTLNNPVTAGNYTLDFIQGATPRDVIFPSTVLVSGGSAPFTLDVTITDNAIDSMDMKFDGTNYNVGNIIENLG